MRKLTKTLVAIATASVLAATAFGVSKSFSAVSADATLNVEYESSYTYGDSLVISNGSISVGDNSAEATATVLLPDGSSAGAGRLTLNQEGVYKVQYSAVVGGEAQTVVRSFSVKKPLFSATSSLSTVTENATYVAKDHEKDGYTNVNGYQIEGKGEVSGVMVSLASGDYFNYNKVIDLSGKTKDETLIEFSITPETIGFFDVGGFDIILTDAYDSSSKVTIRVTAGGGTVPESDAKPAQVGLYNGVSYLRASVGDEFAGMYWSTPGVGQVTKEEYTGSIVYLDFSGVGGDSQHYNNPYSAHADISSIDKNCISISYDDLTKQLFPKKNGYYATGTNEMVDLDDENYFESPWNGFTTGECFLSIRGFWYEKSSFNFVVKEIDGQSVSAIKDDRAAHVIKLDTLTYDESSLPSAVVGYPYPVYQASCVSPYYGTLPVSVKVYEGDAESGTEVAVEDGKFKATRAGVYTIVYSAVDNFGTVVTKSLTINADEDSSPLTITLNGEKITGGVAGQLITPVSATVENAIGASEVYICVKKGSKTYELENGSFRFPCTGYYTISYTATDYVGRTASYEYEIFVETGDAATFTDDVVLPHYFVQGYRYKIPTVYAYDYTNGSQKSVKSVAYIKDANGETRVTGGYVTPSVKKSGDVATIIFEATLNGNVSSASYEIPVIDIKSANGGYDMQKLFFATKGDVSYDVQEFETIVTVKGDSVIDYINPLSDQNFEFAFAGDERMSSFNSISLVLTDVLDPTISVKFTYAKENGKTVFYVNESGKKYEVGEGIASGSDINLTYKAQKNAVSFASSSKVNVAINKTLSGDDFEGFTSGKVYAQIELSGVSASSKVHLKKISNQALCDISYVEYSDPLFGCVSDYGGLKAIGSTVKLPEILVVDAVEPWLSVSLTVTAPDGTTVTAKDGTSLKKADGSVTYEIALKKYGSYVVSYSAEDGSGNRAGLTYLLTVIDDAAPVLNVKGEAPTSGKVGGKLVLPEASATDAIDGKLTVNYYVITNQGQFIVLEGRAFVPQTAGEYSIFVWCADVSGNLACETYTVNVSK